MAMESGVIDGGLLRVLISSDGGTTYLTGYMDTSAELSITHALRDSKTKDSGDWDESSPGTYSWSISGEKLYTVVQTVNAGVVEDDIFLDDLLTLMIPDFAGAGLVDCTLGYESKLVKIKFSTPNGFLSGGWHYIGDAYLTEISISAPNEGENATASYSLTGIGPITKVTVV